MKSIPGKKPFLVLTSLIVCICAAFYAVKWRKESIDSFVSSPIEIVIENLTAGQDMPDLPAVEAAVSSITLPALNCIVRIKNIPISSQKSALRLMSAQGEQIDLVNTGRTDALTEMVGDGLLLPLDDLLVSHGSALLEANASLLDACRVNGQIYAVPAKPLIRSESGFIYNADMANEYHIHISDHPNLDELEQIAEILKAHNKYLLLPSISADTPWLFSALYPNLHPVSTNLYYGVLSQDENHGKILNTYETREYRDYCERMRHWVKSGWIPDNFLLSGLNGNSEFQNENAFMIWNGVDPIELALQSRNYSFRIGMFSTGASPLTTHAVQENGWGISSSCKNPETAMELLNYIYNNEEISNLLMNGLEGREYKKISDHIITFTEGESTSSLKYLRQFTMFGDYRKIYEWLPMTETDYENLQRHYANEPYLDSLFGYSFNVQPVLSEATAVYNVLTDYLPALDCGLIEDVPSALNTLNEKLHASGIDEIIAENQRQLDAWLEQNP